MLKGWGKRPDESWRQYRHGVLETLRIMIFDRELYRHLSGPLDEDDFVEIGEPCAGNCGCRLGTADADRRECGCDEGCCER